MVDETRRSVFRGNDTMSAERPKDVPSSAVVPFSEPIATITHHLICNVGVENGEQASFYELEFLHAGDYDYLEEAEAALAKHIAIVQGRDVTRSEPTASGDRPCRDDGECLDHMHASAPHHAEPAAGVDEVEQPGYGWKCPHCGRYVDVKPAHDDPGAPMIVAEHNYPSPSFVCKGVAQLAVRSPARTGKPAAAGDRATFREWLENRASWAFTNDIEYGAAGLACEALARLDGDTERADIYAADLRVEPAAAGDNWSLLLVALREQGAELPDDVKVSDVLMLIEDTCAIEPRAPAERPQDALSIAAELRVLADEMAREVANAPPERLAAGDLDLRATARASVRLRDHADKLDAPRSEPAAGERGEVERLRAALMVEWEWWKAAASLGQYALGGEQIDTRLKRIYAALRPSLGGLFQEAKGDDRG